MARIGDEKINGLCACLFILGIATLFYIRYPNLWGGMMLVAGGTMVIRQFLMGRLFGVLLSVVVFGGAWGAVTYAFYPGIVIPFLATAGALYILVIQVGRFHRRGTPDEGRSDGPDDR